MKYPIYHFKRSDSSCPRLPKEIWEVSEPPEELFIQGSPQALAKLKELPEKGLAVVGTRCPQARSLALTSKIIRDLAHSGLIIISGLALGIDASAHAAAVECGLTTIAVLGAGVNIDYPKENSELRKRILDSNGLIIAEFSPNTAPRGFHFLRRNRLIAGWSKATWVVEAGVRSGALNTARWARDQNKVCFAVPCYPGDPALAGNQTLLDRDHAFAFWNTHSLGTAWLALAAAQSKITGRIKKHEAQEYEVPLRDLLKQIQTYTYQQGGIEYQELFNWAALRGWTSEQFFTTLHQALELKLAIDQRGVLLST